MRQAQVAGVMTVSPQTHGTPVEYLSCRTTGTYTSGVDQQDLGSSRLHHRSSKIGGQNPAMFYFIGSLMAHLLAIMGGERCDEVGSTDHQELEESHE